MGKQLGFLLDLNKCVGCKGCEIACLNEHHFDQVHYRRVIDIVKDKRGLKFLSLACNHCVNPECIRVCQKQCFYKRRDGIVLHRPQHCNGCQSCVAACPFQVPKVNKRTHKVSKCNFCVERIDKGLAPACVDACVVGALQTVDLSEQMELSEQMTLACLPIIKFTRPSLRVILPKEPRCFWRKGR